MVAIVLVSHSAKLAEGVAELAQQMVQNNVTIAVAAGIDDSENPLGTDVLKIQAAIESVYTETGVVVLMDLGSAIPSTEMAVEFLTPEQQQNVKLCEAPLVEGTIAAAVQASIGADIQQVLTEACSALTPKISQLSATSTLTQISENKPLNLETQTVEITVQNDSGLHARPAAQFVSKAAQFRAEITVKNITKNSLEVNAKSINQVIGLAIRQGDKIAIAATGEDAEPALQTLQEFIHKLNQEISAESISIPQKSTPQQISVENFDYFQGVPASPGIAVGKVVHDQITFPEVKNHHTENPEEEWKKLQTSLQTAQQDLQNIQAGSEIFQAHLLFLKDPELIQQTQTLIFEQNSTAAWAWKTAIESIISTYQALEDPYFRARSVDVQDIGMRVLQLLTGSSRVSLNLSEPGILIASDLTPSEVAQFNPNQVLGICTVAGSATTHSALIANLLGIPMIVNLGEKLTKIPSGTEVALNGTTGEIWLEPDEVKKQELQPTVFKRVDTPSPIPLRANILGVADAKFAIDCGAMGVGLLRTELLYLERSTPPTEEEQVEIYQAIA
ncbi:MAG: dihydroxyacetone kinase phosphoryl donor subunit DhaM [Cyanobacteriota bacterium]|nr:dihydroxyacetone kinase phosphoryl donor subunit DhaM [Cyanobacteriota bacterium]